MRKSHKNGFTITLEARLANAGLRPRRLLCAAAHFQVTECEIRSLPWRADMAPFPATASASGSYCSDPVTKLPPDSARLSRSFYV